MRKRRYCKPIPRPSSFGEPEIGSFELDEPPDPNAHLVLVECANGGHSAPASTMIKSEQGVICRPCWRQLRFAPVKRAKSDEAQSRLF
jgi:hypothetical protein